MRCAFKKLTEAVTEPESNSCIHEYEDVSIYPWKIENKCKKCGKMSIVIVTEFGL